MTTNSKGESSLEERSDRPKTRRASEIQLAQSFVDTVLSSGRKIAQEKRRLKETRATRPTEKSLQEVVGLTTVEKSIFHKQSYYNWTLGILAGATTFGILMGGATLLSKSSRQYVFQKSQQIRSKIADNSKSSTASSRLSEGTAIHIGGAGRKRKVSAKQYAALDRPLASTNITNKTTTTTTATTSLISPSILSDETVLQFQFLACVAASLMVGLGTASSYFDHATFYQQLAQVPLQPGKSFLCAIMCPQLLQQRQELLSQQKHQQNSLDAHSNRSNQAARAMWNDPETIELEAITRLVHHCQLRMEYQAKLQSQQQQLLQQQKQSGEENEQDEDSTIPLEAVAIPEPGVPLQYKY